MEKSHQLTQFARASQEMPPRKHACLEEELKKLYLSVLWLQREEAKYWDSHQKLIYNSGLYILYINKRIFYFLQQELTTGRAYVRRNLYVSNLVRFYQVGPIPGWAYNRDFTMYGIHCLKTLNKH